MKVGFLFFANSILMGFALAMDAFSVSVANALSEPSMKHRKMILIAGTFAFFQIIMPLAGWGMLYALSEVFSFIEKAVPWIALIVLGFLGVKMIIESARKTEKEELVSLSFSALMLQGIATSIDALSVGFTISSLTWQWALVESLIIGAVTFGVCMAGLLIGKTIGLKIKKKAGLVGGIILICIGIEIFLVNIL